MIEYGTSKRMPAPDDPQTSILVLVTNQFQCERLIRTGRKIANLTGTPVYVINVQHRGDKYEANPEALQHLFDVSKHNDAEMKVYFAADPFEQICEIIETYKARHVITGIPVGEDAQLYKFIGPPVVQALKEFCGMTEDEARRAKGVYREYYAKYGIMQCKPIGGAEECLKKLCAAGRTLAVATSKPEPFARAILERYGFTGYFKAIAGGFLDETS